jgi:protein AroM
MKQAMRVFVIGQSPRPEVEAEIAAAVPGVTLILEGALDGLTREQIATEAAPLDAADTLFTVLPSGEATTISKTAVAARLALRLTSLSAGPALLCCTGAFKGLPRRPDIVQPSGVLNALAAALLPEGTLGLFVPVPEQVATLEKLRGRPGLRTTALTLQPLSDTEAIDEAAWRMAAHKPDLVILDCMSYTRADKARIATILACPILLSITAAARATACLLAE